MFRKNTLMAVMVMAFAAIPGSTFAQSMAGDLVDDIKEKREERKNETFSAGRMIGIGYGYTAVSGDDPYCDIASSDRNRNLFWEITDVDFKPYSSGMFSLGLVLDWNTYRLNKNYYWLPSGNAVSPVQASTGGYTKINKSLLRVFSLDLPLDFTQNLGSSASITIGAAAEYNFNGRTKFKGTLADGTKVKDGALRSTEIKTRQFTYNLHAMINWNDMGIYVRYSPQSKFEDGYGPQFSSWTIGIIL